MQQCPQCGYVLGPFDPSCPRCARQETPHQPDAKTVPPGDLGVALRRASDPPAPAPATPAPAAGIPLPAAQPRERRVNLVGLLLLLGFLGAIALMCITLSPPKHATPEGARLTLLQPGGPLTPLPPFPTGKGGRGVRDSAPAVGAAQIDQRLTAAAARVGGEIEVSLAWNSLSDLDLGVRDPHGEMISASHRRSRSGGEQDVDANPTLVTQEGSQRCDAGQPPGAENILPLPDFMVDMEKNLGLPADFPGMLSTGSGQDAPSRWTRTPVEHTYFPQGPKGVYTVYAHCYSWREKDARPLPFTVEVRSRGKVFHAVSGTLGPANYAAHGTPPIQVCQFRSQ